MALTIYGSPFSPFVARVALAAEAKGMKYTIAMPEGGMKGPEHLRLNPFGKVPVLVDGGFSLYESGVIVEYLDAKGKTKPLVPKSAKAAAPLRLIAAVAGEYVQSPGLKIFRHWRSKSADAKALEDAKAELAKGLDVLEKVLVKGKFAGGSRFSIADVFAAPALWFSVNAAAHAGLGDVIGARRKLKSYFAAIQKDKTAKPVLDAMAARLKQMLAGG
jgi:glutathione S-transferase